MNGFGEQQKSKKKSNKKRKPSKEQLINQAIQFHIKGNILEATKYYQQIINQGCNDHRVFSNYGIILKNLGKLKEAKLSYHKAIEIKPDYAEAHSNLGNILQDIGNLKEAEISIRKAIEIKPDYAEAHSNLGNILNDLGNLKDSELSYRKAIEIKPDYAEANYNLGVLLNDLGKSKEAELSFRKTIELQPNKAEAHCNLGVLLQNLGRFKEAELSLRKSIALNSKIILAHIKLGEILFELDKPEEASISEWKAIKLNPLFKYLEYYRENAKIINKTALFIFSHTILNHYKEIIEIDPSSFEILIPDGVSKNIIDKIRFEFGNKDIRIRTHNEVIENKLIYKKLVSNRGCDTREFNINTNFFKNIVPTNFDKNGQLKTGIVPLIKLLGKRNIRLMYTAGKNQNTFSYWNKYFDGILCYGPYHEERFKLRHNIPAKQMGYPRFDKYFKPGFEKSNLIKKFKCDPNKKTVVWITTWSDLSSIEKYYQEISLLRKDHNIVVRPHPMTKVNDPENYKKILKADFNYVDDNEDDNVQLYALADLMLFDYGGSMFGSLYLNKNFAFLDMDLEAKGHNHLGSQSSEDYVKSFFPDRIAKIDNLEEICNYCLKYPPNNSILKSLREEFFNTRYQGDSAKRAFDLLMSDDWITNHNK